MIASVTIATIRDTSPEIARNLAVVAAAAVVVVEATEVVDAAAVEVEEVAEFATTVSNLAIW